MQRFTNVEYDHTPEPIEVYPSGVDVFDRREPKQKEDPQTGEVRQIVECDFNRYDSDEYIKLQMSQYEAVQAQQTKMQLALVEVYEMMI